MRERGFTLLELMVTVAIFGIITAIALPALSQMVANERVRGASFDIQSTLLRARSDALTRNTNITISSISGNWSLGWNIPDPANAGMFIEKHGALTNANVGAKDVGGNDLTSITYTNVGRVGNRVLIDIYGSGTSIRRCVIVELNGRPRTQSCACNSTC